MTLINPIEYPFTKPFAIDDTNKLSQILLHKPFEPLMMVINPIKYLFMNLSSIDDANKPYQIPFHKPFLPLMMISTLSCTLS